MKFFALVTLLFLFAMGCTKSREDRFAQGQGTYLKTASNYESMRHKLKTRSKIAEAPQSETTIAQERIIEGELDNINHFDYVEWESNSDLLNITQDLPIRAPENHEYEIRYQLTEKYLKVLKVGKLESFPYEEWNYKEVIDEELGLYGIPMVGFEVKWYKTEKSLNADNERTHIVQEIPVQSRAESTHFKINRTSGKTFNALGKKDMYPVDFFTQGEWYFSEFYSGTVAGAKAMPGDSCRPGGYFAPTMKIRFEKRENSIIGKVALIPEENDYGREIDRDVLVTIPVEWFDSRVARSGSDTGLEEVEVKDRQNTSKPFVKMDLTNISSVCSKFTDGDAAGKVLVQKVKFAKDYFSVTLANDEAGLRKTFAFWRRANDKAQEYQVRNFHEQDYKYFGYFWSAAQMAPNFYQYYTESDIRNRRRISRFDPNKTVYWHISSESPQEKWIRDVSKQAVDYWQMAFTEAGTGMTIAFADPLEQCPTAKDPQKVAACWDSTKTKPAGDLRYNTLNYIRERAGLLGYGPMRADPLTGETISAHSQMYFETAKSGIYHQVRSYIMVHLGLFNHEVTNLDPFRLNTPVGSASTHNHLMGNLAHDGESHKIDALAWSTPSIHDIHDGHAFDQRPLVQFPQIKLNPKGYPQVVVDEEPAEQSPDVDPSLQDMWSLKSHFVGSKITNSHVFAQRIAKHCPELTKEKVQSAFPDKDLTVEKLRPVAMPCVDKLLPILLLPTIVHEMGHNFGLGHNFTASTDKKNFFTIGDFERIYNLTYTEETLPQSTSIMEYDDDSRNHALVTPGPYDIAAIRYAYSTCTDGKKNCGFIKKSNSDSYIEIPNNLSITQVLSESPEFAEILARKNKAVGSNAIIQEMAQVFSYCQDPSRDPFCQTFDVGTTSAEILKNLIDDYRTSLAFGTKRLNRAKFGLNQANVRLGRFLIPMRRHYDHWRLRLKDILSGQVEDPMYLSGLNAAEFQQVLEEIKAGKYRDREKYSGEFADMLEMRNILFDFLTEIALIPNQYCLVSREVDGAVQYDAIEFERAREELKHTATTAKSCKDQVVREFFAQQGWQVLDESGMPMFPFRYSMDENDDNMFSFPVDESGVAADRFAAIIALGARFPSFRRQLRESFFPNVFDEPDFRISFYDRLRKRILDGQDINFAAVSDNKVGLQTMKRFHYEQEILPDLARLYYQGLFVPGNSSETLRRIQPFQSIAARNQIYLQNNPASTSEGGVTFATQSFEAYEARRIIERHRYLDQLSDSSQVPAPIDERFISVLYPLVLEQLPPTDEEITYEKMYGLGQVLTAVTETSQLDEFIRQVAPDIGLDPEDEQLMAQTAQSIRWFFNHEFVWDKLIYSSLLTTDAGGSAIPLPIQLDRLQQEEEVAREIQNQWQTVFDRYMGQLDDLQPLISQLEEIEARVAPVKEQIEGLEGQIAAVTQILTAFTAQRDEIVNSWTRPEDCAEGSTEDRCTHPSQADIDLLNENITAGQNIVETSKQELAQAKAQIEEDLAKIDQLNIQLEEQNYTDILKMMRDAQASLGEASGNTARAEQMAAQFEAAINSRKQINFANIYDQYHFEIKTQESLSLDKVLERVRTINFEREWALGNGAREKEAQQNMLIQFLLSLSGQIL